MTSLAIKTASRDIGLELIKMTLASLFIGLCAQVEIPLYFTPVPLTIQTTAIMLVGATLGKTGGAFAVMAYLVQGCLGMPVFAGGSSGVIHILGPTGGYLLAYIMQAYVVGLFFERQKTLKFFSILGILMLTIVIQLLIGSLWLAQFTGLSTCLMLGFNPFIISEAIRAFLLAGILSKINR